MSCWPRNAAATWKGLAATESQKATRESPPVKENLLDGSTVQGKPTQGPRSGPVAQNLYINLLAATPLRWSRNQPWRNVTLQEKNRKTGSVKLRVAGMRGQRFRKTSTLIDNRRPFSFPCVTLLRVWNVNCRRCGQDFPFHRQNSKLLGSLKTIWTDAQTVLPVRL